VNRVPEKPDKPKKKTERTWTPNAGNQGTGAHTREGYVVQTDKKTSIKYAEGQLPAKKSLSDLP
jgi:hypothetical protein